VDAEAGQLARRIRAWCMALPDPTPDAIFYHVYSEPHPLVEEERAWLAAYESSLEPAPAGGDR